MVVLAISGTIMLSVFFSLQHIYGLITAAFLLNLMYTGPLLLEKPLHLPKLFTYLKSNVVGFVWAFVSVFLSIANAAAEIQFADLVLFFNQFMLVSLNVLIFDYRDKLPDYEFGIHTPANMLNEKQFSVFYYANLFIYTASVIGVATAYKLPVFLLQLPLAIVLAFLFHKSKKSQGELFYLFGVDGMMILALLLSLFLRF
jgi:1,4-dihydroxy-2-naphthoate octaprenyltransferase